MRLASAPARSSRSVDPGAFAGFGIAVDGMTLVDTLTRLFQRGLFAKVPTIATCASRGVILLIGQTSTTSRP